MGTPFKLDDILGTNTTDGTPPQKKKAANGSYALDDLLGPDSAAPAAPAAPGAPARPSAPGPLTGDIDLRDGPSTAQTPIVAPRPAPDAGRGMLGGLGGLIDRARPTISSAIDKFLAVPDFNAPRDPNAPIYASGRPDKAEETRTPAEITDWRTTGQKATSARRAMEAQIGAPRDQTAVRPAGSLPAQQDDTATRDANDQQARRRFSPEGWRDVAKRGMAYANQRYADAEALKAAGDERGAVLKKREADAAARQSYNAQLLSENAATADTFGAIALSNLLGIVHDPYAGEKRNMQDIAATGATFSPEEQQAKLGKNLPVETSRPFDLTDPRDTVAPLVGGLPVFMAGGAVGRAGLDAAAGGLEALNLPRAARIADAIGAEAETAGIYGPKQAGLGGVREAAENFGQNLPTLVKRGLVQGQGTGAVMAAREAQQTGGDPIEAAVGSVLANAPLGVLGEVGGGALTRLGPVADRSIAGALDRVHGKLDEMRGIDPALGARMERIAETAPVDRRVLASADQGAEAAGKLPVSDKTREGQHQTIAEALDQVLAQKENADTFGSDVSPILRDRSTLEPRTPIEEPNPPLRTAREVGLERAGVEPVRPSDEANAVVQMERAERDAEAHQRAVAEAEQQARIEQAAAARAVERQGPLTLSQTLARAGRDAADGEPLAAEYHKAITDFAAATARMQDAGEAPSAKLKFDWAKAKAALNDARQKYGVKAGAAAIGALASADSDLTDDERKMIGLGALAAVGSTEVARRLPGELRARAITAVDNASVRSMPRVLWMEHLADQGVHLGEHYATVDAALHQAALTHGGPHVNIPAATVRSVLEDTPVALRDGVDVPLTNRMLAAVERVSLAVSTAPPEVWAAKLEAAGVQPHEADAVMKALRDDDSGASFSPGAVKRVIAAGLTPPEGTPATLGTLYSRLGRAVETLPGKAWDAPRPAADWIGKLKGLNTFSKAEFALIEPALREAAESKTKLTRADVTAIVDERVPRVERHTLAYGDHSVGHAAHGDPDYIEPIDDISPETHSAEEIRQQIDNREAEISRIEDAITERQDEAAEGEHAAQESLRTAESRLESIITEHFPDSDSDVLDAATQYLRDHVEAEHVPRGAVDRAFEKLIETGDFYKGDEPREPEHSNLRVEETTHANGEPIWVVTSERNGPSNGKQWVGQTREEALAHAEHAGFYDPDGEDFLLPKDSHVQHVPENAETGEPERWVLKDGSGRILHESETSRADLMEEYVRDNFRRADNEEQLRDLKDQLFSYADALAEYQRAESEHYWMTEGDYFNDEQNQIEKLRGETEVLAEMHEQARSTVAEEPAPERAEGDAVDPLTVPAKPRITGKPRFESYQRIGGGTDYAELLNVWQNNPGEQYMRGHWSGTPDTVSHVRAETQRIDTVPGLGAQIEYPAGEPEPARLARAQIAEVRQKRTTVEQQMTVVEREYTALPEAVRDASSAEARSLASKYADLANQVKTLADRETELTERVRSESALPAESQPIRVLIESQSDLAQDAQKHGVRRPVTPEERAAYDQQLAELDTREAANEERQIAVRDTIDRLQGEWTQIGRRTGKNLPMLEEYRTGGAAMTSDIAARERATFAALDPRLPALIDEYNAARDAHKEAIAEHYSLQSERNAAYAEFQRGRDRNAVPPGPFTETRTAQALNVARFLTDAANRGAERIAISDAANRARLAHLPIPAAKLTYDELLPSLVRSMLGSLGFRDVPMEHTYIKGYGHWTWSLTPEMRAAIRKHGLPVMGVLAALAVPDDAEAQGEGGGAKAVYGSALGGVAAGLLLAHLASNKKLRRLVNENRDLSRALLRDDLSGLANKKAHTLAIDSVDRDPATAWLAFDGDRFKQMNDVYGHPVGDQAIQHFGDVMRRVAKTLDVPMRGFRPGGDEFAMAVPKARAAEVLRAIEDASPFIMDAEGKSRVETKLTGSLGDTWGEADALLTAKKDARRAADPSLIRTTRPDIEAKLSKEMNDALDRMGGVQMFSNPIGPALAQLRQYPSAAGLAVVGTLMATESDNENIKRAGIPVMALAALSAIGSDRLLAGKDLLASRLVDRLRKSPEGTKAVRFFNPDALLTPEVRAAIREFERGQSAGRARAAEFSGKAKKLGPEGDRAVSDVLDREDWEDTAGFTTQQLTDVLSVAGEFSAEYDRLTQEQVAAGTLAPERVIADYGGPRRYAYWDAMDAMADSPRAGAGGPGRTARIAPTRARSLDIPIRDAERALAAATATGDQAKITEAQSAVDEARAVQMTQRVALGEIREASYRAAVHIEQAHNSVASAKLFETVKNVPGAVHPDWQTAVDEFQAARDMLRDATTPADRTAAEALRDQAYVKMAEISRRFAKRGGEYVALPTTPGLGVLSGAVVKRDIAHSLEGFGTPGLYGKLLRQWKELKTVFNPGTSIGNILSNVTALHLGDVPIHLQPYYYTQAVRDLRSYGEGTRALAEAGVLNVNSVNALGTGELGRGMRSEQGLEELLPTTRPETQRVLRQEGITEHGIAMKQWSRRMKGMAVGAAIGAAKTFQPDDPTTTATGALVGAGVGALAAGRLGDLARRVYDNEDNVARLAVFLRRRKLGDTIEQARDRAVSALGDFRSRSPALRMVSSTVSPFVMYQAKAVPAFAKNVIDHPWKYMTLIAAWGAMNELSKQDVGEVPETDIPVNMRRTYGYFFPGFTQLPLADDRGNKGAVDMARWTPMSGLTTGAPPGSVPEAFGDNASALVTPGGPVIDAALQASNVDPFTRDPLLKRDRPTSENVATVAHRAADFVLPSAAGFHVERLREDINNADWTKFQNDLLGPTGAKPRYVRPGAVATDAAYTLDRSLRDMKQEFKRALRANKDPDRVSELSDQYKRRVATALANFKQRLGTAPPRELVDEYLHHETPDDVTAPDR